MNLYLKHSLYFAVAKAIESSIQGLTSHQEPDLVASLVTNLPQKLSVVLPQYISGVKFNIGGCFIHQKQKYWIAEVIPFSILGLGEAPKSIMANFYKCGDKCEKPHFLSMAPIDTPSPCFHCPEFFQEVKFI